MAELPSRFARINPLNYDEAVKALAALTNGFYNQFWPLNCKTLSRKELKIATTSIAKIANKILARSSAELGPFNQYLAAAAVAALVRMNSKARDTPLLARLDELEKVIIRLGRSVAETCGAKTAAALQNSATILSSFAKTLDPIGPELNLIDTEALFELIEELQESGLFDLCITCLKKKSKLKKPNHE